jgi:hypothetical protein
MQFLSFDCFFDNSVIPEERTPQTPSIQSVLPIHQVGDHQQELERDSLMMMCDVVGPTAGQRA